MLQVVDLVPKNNFKLYIRLSNGKAGEFDVKPYLDKGIFTELKDWDYFRLAKITFGGIMWPNQQDFSADTLEMDLQ